MSMTIALRHVVMYMRCGAAMMPWAQMPSESSKRGDVRMLSNLRRLSVLLPLEEEEAVHVVLLANN